MADISMNSPQAREMKVTWARQSPFSSAPAPRHPPERPVARARRAGREACGIPAFRFRKVSCLLANQKAATLTATPALSHQSVIANMLARFSYGTDNGEVLAEYVTVMIINNKSLRTVNSELGELIGGDYDPAFGQSLFQALGKIEPGPTSHPAIESAAAGSPVAEQQADAPAAAPAQSASTERREPLRGHRHETRRSPRREGVKHPTGSARIFTNAIGGALRNAANAGNPETVDELRRYLESDDRQPNEAAPTIASQGNTQWFPRDRVFKGADAEQRIRSASQTPPAPTANRPRKAPVQSRLGDRMNPYSRPPQHSAGSAGSVSSNQAEARWNIPTSVPALPMSPFFPPMTPEMMMSLGLPMPPGFPMSIHPAGMMPIDSTFTVQLGPMRLERGPGRRNNIGGHGQSPSGDNNVVLPGTKVRCHKWPNCASGKVCKYFHPTKICPKYPICPNDGRTCTFIHPDTNPVEARTCHENGGVYPDPKIMDGLHRPAAHQEPTVFPPTARNVPQWSSQQATSVAVTTSAGFPGQTTMANGGLTSCKFGANCTKPTCHFLHPSTSSALECRFHPNCKKLTCTFSHPGQVGRSGGKPYGTPLAESSNTEDTEMAEAVGDTRVAPSADTKPSVQELLDCSLEDAASKLAPASLYKNPVPCRDGASCSLPVCYFTHPWEKPRNIPCRFGTACTRPGCSFQHPWHQNRSVVFNKSAPSETHRQMDRPRVSDREFSLPGVVETIIPGKTANGAQLDPAIAMVPTASAGGA